MKSTNFLILSYYSDRDPNWTGSGFVKAVEGSSIVFKLDPMTFFFITVVPIKTVITGISCCAVMTVQREACFAVTNVSMTVAFASFTRWEVPE